ncbi:MAG: GPO family capsid scaffolding protein [Pseudohongiellaceae bacterium]
MKWFRVATEGATTDGRKISREWIEQMAKNYDPGKYGARVWMEHMRGLFADGPFRAFGDVLAVEAKENGDGKLELFVQLDPTEDLIEMNKQRQKVYSSIEVDHDFADTGEAYLVGMAVTDSPASLGTEMLQFSANAQSNPLNARKEKPSNVFTAAIETEFDFSDVEQDDPAHDTPSLLDSVKALFRRHKDKTSNDLSAFRKDLESTLEEFVNRYSELSDDLATRPDQKAFKELKAAHEDLKKRFDNLYSKLDQTPDTPPRSTATGSDGAQELTDC